MNKPIINMPASVHQRLLNKARQTKRPFGELLQYYAMERFLYRLSRSKHSRKFILKGALMFWAWEVLDSRATMDIDLLGKTQNAPEKIASLIKEVCSLKVADDGLRFDPSTVSASRIVEGADYHGVRVKFMGFLAHARIPMQIDIGFGDPVLPGPVPLSYPTLLDFPSPRLMGYRRENTIAEKFEAMCVRGLGNSRMKDFFDIWLLCRRFDFDGSTLSEAIRSTFHSRHMEISAEPIALSPKFSKDKNKIIQWKAFLRKSRIPHAPKSLQTITKELKKFFSPVTKSLAEGKLFTGKWHASGSWKRKA